MAKSYKIGEIFRKWGEAFIQQYRPHPTVCRAIRAISKCRTQVLGGLRVLCQDCGCEHIVFASCGNRSCPICPALKKEIWLMKRQEELLPVKYYHLVFTLPSELNDMCKNHPRLMYNILLRAAWQSLKAMMGDEKWCGAQAGMMAVLHTWGQNLSFHPHLHCVVPAGGLSFDGNGWIGTRHQSVLVDVKDLSALFQKTFMRMLREHWETNGIVFRGKTLKYNDIKEWRALFESVQKPWVVFAKAPSKGATQTLDYLSRYTHAVAISEYRILELTDESVKISYKDYADEDEKGIPKKKTTELEGIVFMKRFVQHILPKGFQKIRYFGIWASPNRKTKLLKCQRLLNLVPVRLTTKIIKELVKLKMGIDSTLCQHCGSSNIVTQIMVSTSRSLARNKIVPIDTTQGRSPPVVIASPKSATSQIRA